MEKWMVLAILLVIVCTGIAYAADKDSKAPGADGFGEKTVRTITDTAQSTVEGTAKIAKTSVEDIGETPKTAIESVKDTANTALNRADAAIKTITGEDR